MFVKHRAFQMSFIQMATNTHRMLFINDQADKKHGNNLIQSKLKLIVIEQHEVSNSLLTPFFLFVQLGLETGPQNTGTACTSKVGFYPCFYLPSVSRKGLFSKLRRMTELRYIPENLCSSNLPPSACTYHYFVYFFNSKYKMLFFF